MQKQNDLINNLTVQQMFDDYCSWRLGEAKNKKEYDYCIEQFAKTELFDLKLKSSDYNVDVTLANNEIPFIENYKDYALPFERQFVRLPKISDLHVSVFIGEYSPTITTGTLFSHFKGMYDATAFTILPNGVVQIDFVKNNEDYKKYTTLAVMSTLQIAFSVLTKLNKHTVVEDKPTGVVKYYRRKLAPTIKVVDRPIYYVLDKKYKSSESYRFCIKNPIGKLSPTHAFKVRGFWRTFNGKQLGKNREGKRVVEGYTWVKEHVRGYGELRKKLRVVK